MLLFLCCSLECNADADVRLITIGPGDAFWSAFGHTALAVNDDVYGFGYFSFDDEGLIQSFIANQMYYDIGLSDFADELAMAEWQNRTFMVQDLRFTPEAKKQLVEHLKWHNLPENQSYRYDYFLNNCATKIRDLLDEAWQGAIKDKFNKNIESSYFAETFPAKNQALMNFGLVLGYGWSAYEGRTAWELMAFPVFLHTKMAELSKEKITSEQIYYQSIADPALYSWFKTHWFLWVYVVIVFLGLKWSLTQAFVSGLVATSQLLLGAGILFFWVFSGLEITHWNFNVLLFSPFVVLLFISTSFKWLVLAGYISWGLIAVFLQAWYFFPVLLLHMFWLHQKYVRKI